MSIERICKECGKVFAVRPSRIKFGPCSFCSRSCHYAHRRNYRQVRSDGQGYQYSIEDHPTNAANLERLHRVIAARVLGRAALPKGVVVHHVNDDGTDNRTCNLVILQNQSEHKTLHDRRKVFRLGGNPFFDSLCGRCGEVKPLIDFTGGRPGWCKACARERMKAYMRERAKRDGIRPDTLRRRLLMGWSPAKAMSEPVRPVRS